MENRDVVFDLDGTLLDTIPDIAACMKSALEDNNLPTGRFDTEFVIGPPLGIAVKDFLPAIEPEIVDRVIDRFRVLYDSSSYPLTKPYADIESLLSQLHDQNNRLFIATNKRKFPTVRLIEKMGWTSLFTDIITIDFSPSGIPKSEMLIHLCKKWNITPSTAAMIGDTSSDIDAGHTAGFNTIAVTWGYGDYKKLVDSVPDKIVNSAREIK